MKYKVYNGIDYNGAKVREGFRIEYEENLHMETNNLIQAKDIFEQLSTKCKENCKKKKRYCYYTYVTESYPKEYSQTIMAHRYNYNMQTNEVECEGFEHVR